MAAPLKCSSYKKYETRTRNPDPKISALLVIDVQNYFSSMAKPILPNLLTTIDLCRRASIPVFFTRHNHISPADYGMLGDWWDNDLVMDGTVEAELMPEIRERAAEDEVVEKNTYSTFQNTGLQDRLVGMGVKEVIVTGVMTNLCCETTAREAFVKGFRVFFSTDATATSDKELHESTLKNLAYGFAYLVDCKRLQQALFENPKPARSSAESNNNLNNNKVANHDVDNKNIAAQTFTFRELATATKNFRQECLIGEGGFGRVYKGKLDKGGQIVAVKQLDRNGLQGNREFLVEVLMLSLLHHQNLVNLIGYCADGDQRLLVYEYMPMGSLEDHLLDLTPQHKSLDWPSRMKIALGAAKGLEYLHDKANPPVIYRDLKSSNILLDNFFNAKLSDFGLAKLGPVGDKTHVSSRVMGTYGYCAPEYQRTGQLTVKSDVYSFGVVLLELITGRRAIDTTRHTAEQNLVSWATPIFKDPSRYPDLADPLLRGDYAIRNLNQAVAVAAMCLHEEAAARPYISDVVTALSALENGPDKDEPVPARSPAASGNNNQTYQDEENSREREKAVAEAMEWGSHSRNANSPRNTTLIAP